MLDSPLFALALGWIVFGSSVGLVARSWTPDRPPAGWVAAIGLAIAGSAAGGLLANFLLGGTLLESRTPSWIGSLVGALVSMAVLSAVTHRRSRHLR